MNKQYDITRVMELLKHEECRLRKKLQKFEPEGPEYAQVFECYMKIHNQLNEYAKTASEDHDKMLGRWIGLGVSLSTCSIPLIFKTVWFIDGLHFEEVGSYCSQTLKWVLDGFRTK